MNKQIEEQVRAEVWKSELNQNSDANLSEVFTELWRKKWLIIAFGVLFGVIGIFYSLSLPNIYKSSAVIAPAGDSEGQGLSSVAGLGGLATLAGFNLSSASAVDKTQMALQILNSRKFISDFVNRHELKPYLFAVEEWVPESNEVIYDVEVYDAESKKWTRPPKFPLKAEPSDLEVVERFREHLLVEESDKQGFYQVSFQHNSPYVAAKIVNDLINDLNSYMRIQEQQEANESIKFLNEKIVEVNAAEIRAVMYELIEEQTKTLMFTEVRDEYVFQTVDPAVVPEQRDSPARTVIVVFTGIFGGVLGCIVVLISLIARKIKNDDI